MVGDGTTSFSKCYSLVNHGGLVVRCAVDDTKYEKGIKISDDQLKASGVKKHDFHGDWNYTFNKQKIG